MESFVKGYVVPKEISSTDSTSVPKLNLNASQVLPIIISKNIHSSRKKFRRSLCLQKIPAYNMKPSILAA